MNDNSPIDLGSSRHGGAVLSCNDEFFAEAHNLIAPGRPVWREGEYTDRGKWMDGWETRRRRDEGNDWCVVALGLPGIIDDVIVDTSHFTGNYPERFSLDASGDPPERVADAEWHEIVPPTPLEGDTAASHPVTDPHRATMVRLNIFPDGGVARMRLMGRPIPERGAVCPEGRVDLASALVGGRGSEASDTHYASVANLVSPTEPAGMWDGWETRRRRGPGHDWAIVELGLSGTVEAFDVDTRHFRGNAPGWVSFEVSGADGDWVEVCERVEVEPNTVNQVGLARPVPADRVRVNIHPDGGLARLRVWGRPYEHVAEAARVAYLDALFPGPATAFFTTACGSRRWAKTMTDGRPYESVAAALAASERAFADLDHDDWLEAFAAHPRIGESGGRQTSGGAAMSEHEQSGLGEAATESRRRLVDVNSDYEKRFGYTYIVRAAGRDADEMYRLACERLQNDPETEMGVAAAQQREITTLRLRQMLCMRTEIAELEEDR